MATREPSLQLVDALKSLDRRVPRPAKPEPKDEDAYWRGVSHGFHTALCWAEEISRSARLYATAQQPLRLIDFLRLADEFTAAWAADESPHVMFDDDPQPQ